MEWAGVFIADFWGHRGYRILAIAVLLQLGTLFLLVLFLLSQSRWHKKTRKNRRRFYDGAWEVLQRGEQTLLEWIKQESIAHSRELRDTLLELGKTEFRDQASVAWHTLGFAQKEYDKLEKGTSARRLRAIRRIYVFADEGAREPILSALAREDDHRFRITAGQALGRIGNGRDVMKALEGVYIARRTMEQPFYATFRDLPESELAAILDGDIRDLGVRVRHVLLEVGAERGIESVLDRLEAMATHEDTRRRRGAARICAKFDHPRTRPVLRQLLKDEQWDVRALAAKGLGLIGSREDIALLEEAVSDPEFWVRENAGWALGCLRESAPDGAAKQVEKEQKMLDSVEVNAPIFAG